MREGKGSAGLKRAGRLDGGAAGWTREGRLDGGAAGWKRAGRLDDGAHCCLNERRKAGWGALLV